MRPTRKSEKARLQSIIMCGVERMEGVNGVNRLATKGEKILLTTDKTGKKLPTGDKKINWDLPTTHKGRKFSTDNRQSNGILTDNRHLAPTPPSPTPNGRRSYYGGQYQSFS